MEKRKSKETDLVGERLADNMKNLYNIVRSAYKASVLEPVFLGYVAEDITIKRLVVTDVPQSVISAIFKEVQANKEEIKCDYVFRYHFTHDKAVYEFEIEA